MEHRSNIPSNQYLKGLDDVVSNIQDAVDRLEQRSTVGLADALLFVAVESQQRAPVDTGDLRGSVEVTLDDNLYAKGIKGTNETDLIVVSDLPETASKGAVSYNTPYAVDQHEQTGYDHPKGGQAKYLESVIIENKDDIIDLIANAISDGLEG